MLKSMSVRVRHPFRRVLPAVALALVCVGPELAAQKTVGMAWGGGAGADDDRGQASTPSEGVEAATGASTDEVLGDGTQVGLALDGEGRPFAYRLTTDGRLLVDGPLSSSAAELGSNGPIADMRPDRLPDLSTWGVTDAPAGAAEALFPPGTLQLPSGGLAVTKWVQKYTGGIIVRHFVTIPVNYTCEGCTCTIAAIGDAISNMPGTLCATVGESASESVTCGAETGNADCPDGQSSESVTVIVECCDQNGNCKLYYIDVDACPS